MRSMLRLMLGLTLVAIVGLGSNDICAQETPRTLVQDLIVPAEPPAAPAAEAQASGYLGLTVDLMAPDGKSVYIVSVVEGGPAAKGGLSANDVIMEVNRQAIGNLQDLDRVVRQPAGTKLEFKVRRDNVPQRFEVTLGARSATPMVDELPAPASAQAARQDAVRNTPAPQSGGGQSVLKESTRPNLGIKVVDAERLSDADKLQLGVVVNTGAMISDISEGAPAARAGLPIGGVVVSINGTRIRNAQDIVDLVQTFRPGQQIEVTYWEGDRMGRKKVRVGRTAVDVTPGVPDDVSAVPADPRARLRRRDSDRPLLNALGRILDDVLPPGTDSPPAENPTPATPSPLAGAADAVQDPADAMLPPPPPRIDTNVELPELGPEPPVVELPEPRTDANEIKILRKQAADMQRQLETLLRRIKELEEKKQTPEGRDS